MRSCTCTLPAIDAERPGYCENCGGTTGATMAKAALGAIGHELRGVHLRLEAAEQTQATGAVELRQRMEALEESVAELAGLVQPTPAAEPWQSPDQIAAWLGVSVETVRDHAREWSGVRIGDGPKARWRFRRSLIEAALGSEPRPESAPPTVRRRPRRRGAAELLPIKKGGVG